MSKQPTAPPAGSTKPEPPPAPPLKLSDEEIARLFYYIEPCRRADCHWTEVER